VSASNPPAGSIKIAVDCRYIDAPSGVGVYQRETLPWFLQSPHDFLLAGDAKKIADFLTSLFSKPFNNASVAETFAAKTRYTITDLGDKPFSLRELCIPPSCVKAINECDCFYSPFFSIPRGIKIPVYTTIHDIIFPDMRELCGRAALAARMYFYRRAAKISKSLFTVSFFSKSRLQHHLPLGRKPVIVTYNAAQSYLQKPPAVAKKPYIIFVGNIKKHKGLKTLLEAFIAARERGLKHTLLIVGSYENFRTSDRQTVALIKKYAEDEFSAKSGPRTKPTDDFPRQAVCFSGFVSNERLKILLAGASLLVQPSLYEGFGYPPLEAMTVGTAALISDIPVFREIYRGFPVTFFKTSGDLTEKLLSAQIKKITLTKEQREQYTFKKTAGIILSELEKCR
jgi:glycosyltransferase involved in cell wall biosynthesis